MAIRRMVFPWARAASELTVALLMLGSAGELLSRLGPGTGLAVPRLVDG
jgi:hypothetical protein